MSPRLTLVFLVIALGVAHAKVDLQKAKRHFDECQRETQAEETFVDVIRDRKIPTSQKGKCLMRCLMIKRNIIDSNDVYNPVGAAVYFKEVYEEVPEKLEPALKVAARCSTLVSPIGIDKCELAVKRITCSKVEGAKENLQIKE